MGSRKISILVVDDDIRMLRMMQRILDLEGYRALTASNGENALDMFFEQDMPHLVLLDVMMPGMDGYTVCQRIREFSPVPIIIVTAKGNEEEKAQGLDAGADDYVTKPFSAKELAARVRAVLRRTALWYERPKPAFRSGDLVIDFARHLISLDGQDVGLSATEYRVLSYLAGNADRVVTPDQVLEKVWGEEYLGELHLLQANISRLRKKLKEDTRNPKYILTKPGIGYMLTNSPRSLQ